MGAEDRDNIDSDFDGVLDSIRRDAEKVLQGTEALDPDQLIERFGQEAADLAGLVAREEAEAVQRAQTKATAERDFGTLLECAVQRLVIGSGSPVLLRTNFAADLPVVAADGTAVAKLCDHSLMLAIHHAGDGGYVSLTTRVEDDCVVFELVAEPGFEGSDQAASPTSPELEKLALEADGEFDMGLDGHGVLHAAITLIAAPVA